MRHADVTRTFLGQDNSIKSDPEKLQDANEEITEDRGGEKKVDGRTASRAAGNVHSLMTWANILRSSVNQCQQHDGKTPWQL